MARSGRCLSEVMSLLLRHSEVPTAVSSIDSYNLGLDVPSTVSHIRRPDSSPQIKP